ncbi:MAG: sarcosine oxidase subunit gamma family protein [Amaricoccus sp.]
MTTATPGVTITELPPTTRVSLRLADPAAIHLPTDVGTRSAQGGRTALCLGPDEWLIEAPESERAALLADLARIPVPHSAVDVSDREIGYALEGPAVLTLLATGAPRDLAAMPVGSGARTVFDTAQVVLTRETDTRFHLTVWRSFAPHVRALLALAERELAAGL